MLQVICLPALYLKKIKINKNKGLLMDYVTE